jgi:hypothetical protein
LLFRSEQPAQLGPLDSGLLALRGGARQFPLEFAP